MIPAGGRRQAARTTASRHHCRAASEQQAVRHSKLGSRVHQLSLAVLSKACPSMPTDPGTRQRYRRQKRCCQPYETPWSGSAIEITESANGQQILARKEPVIRADPISGIAHGLRHRYDPSWRANAAGMPPERKSKRALLCRIVIARWQLPRRDRDPFARMPDIPLPFRLIEIDGKNQQVSSADIGYHR